MNLMRRVGVFVLIVGIGSPIQTLGAQSREEAVLWATIQKSDNPEDYRAYLDAYPNGTFAPLARRRIASLVEAKAAEGARRSREEAELQKLIGYWVSDVYVPPASVSYARDAKLTAELTVTRSVGGVTGSYRVRDAGNIKCQNEAEINFSTGPDGKLFGTIVSGRHKCNITFASGWTRYDKYGLAKLEFSGEKLRIRVLARGDLSPSDPANHHSFEFELIKK